MLDEIPTFDGAGNTFLTHGGGGRIGGESCAAGRSDPVQFRRLWSLWDMFELKAASFYGVTSGLHSLRHQVESGNAKSIEQHADGGMTIRPTKEPAVVQHLLGEIAELKENLAILDLDLALLSAAKLETEISSERGFVWERVGRMCEEIHGRLLDGLSLTKVFVLERRGREYYSPPTPLFGTEVASKSPTDAAFEIDEAAKCLAFGRPTASVFHLMRTMEVGIRAVARCLQIPDPLKPGERNWGFILGAIKDGAEAKWPTGATRMSGDGALFEELHASLEAVRNPWRNATMHVEKKYTDDEAEHIFVAVKGFMKKLASRCDEDGEPKLP